MSMPGTTRLPAIDKCTRKQGQQTMLTMEGSGWTLCMRPQAKTVVVVFLLDRHLKAVSKLFNTPCSGARVAG